MNRDERNPLNLALALSLLASALLGACRSLPAPGMLPGRSLESGQSEEGSFPGSSGNMTLFSENFAEGESIPPRFTCDGEDLSPQLGWEHVPAEASTFVLILDDPDAPSGTWTHWAVYNLPLEVVSLPAGAGSALGLSARGETGLNSWGDQTYGGPCPPSGTHRYFFRVYALDTPLAFSSPPTVAQIQAAMHGHVLAQASLMGFYARSDS
jgi:hypothetical protein